MIRKRLAGAAPVALGCWALLLANGCGTNAPPASPNESATAESQGQVAGSQDGVGPDRNEPPPTASIGSGRSAKESNPPPRETGPPDPEEGSPEWLLREIVRLRKSPLPGEPEGAELEKARRKRDEQVVELATEAIAQTHNDSAQQDRFLRAVTHLMEARLKLALEGETEHIDALYADADALYQRNPESKAAAEAAFICARFAHTNARRFGPKEPRWLKEFARQATAFAEKFPEEESRAVSLLHAAAWSCELHGLLDEAAQCYEQLETGFPDTPQGQVATAALRRLRLNGQPLQLAGPTLNGDFVSIDDYAGRVVLIVFWASDNPQFQHQLPKLTEAIDALPQSEFAVLGVNLDEVESTLVEFCKEHGLDWPQIFYPDAEKRRWNNPIAQYYGVRGLPMLWLVDQQGRVVETRLALDQLQRRVRSLLGSAERDSSETEPAASSESQSTGSAGSDTSDEGTADGGTGPSAETRGARPRR